MKYVDNIFWYVGGLFTDFVIRNTFLRGYFKRKASSCCLAKINKTKIKVESRTQDVNRCSKCNRFTKV